MSFLFDASLRERWHTRDARWSFDVPETWMQGRAVFGGLMAAAAVSLAKRRLDPAWRLRTINVQFLRPCRPGSIEGVFTVRRQGKGSLFAEVVLSQTENGESNQAVAAQLVFTRPRDGAIEVAPAARVLPPFEGGLELPYIPGVTPEFTQHLAMRWLDGGLPYSGAERARFVGSCRFRDGSGDVEGVIGLLDAWPAPTLSILTSPAPASSVMWTAHVFEVPSRTQGWFGYDYETIAGAGGAHTCVGRLYTPSGRLLAWSEQHVAVFA